MYMIERINVTDCIVLVGLVVALLLAMYNGLNELATSIASGLLGYVGGSVNKTAKRGDDNR
nr:MAG TPA: hypothetical protein [Caudoviricetes sp.]